MFGVFAGKPGKYRVTSQQWNGKKQKKPRNRLEAQCTVQYAVDAVLKGLRAQEIVSAVVRWGAGINTEDQTISQTLNNLAVVELAREPECVYPFNVLNTNDAGSRRWRIPDSWGTELWRQFVSRWAAREWRHCWRRGYVKPPSLEECRGKSPVDVLPSE